MLSEARLSTGLYLGVDRKLCSLSGGGSKSSSSNTTSGELLRELLGEGEHPPMEDRSQFPFARLVISCAWLSNTYGELGCSLQRSTKSRRLSLATSSGFLSSGRTGGGACGGRCGGGGLRCSHECRRHSVAPGRDLRQRPLLLAPNTDTIVKEVAFLALRDGHRQMVGKTQLRQSGMQEEMRAKGEGVCEGLMG